MERKWEPWFGPRHFPIVELRVEGGDDQPKLVGHAAVFDVLSEELWPGVREKIRKNAFAKTLKESDARALFNHNPDWVLGRTKNGTLRLAEDDVGLAVEIDPPHTQYARDFLEVVRRGDVDQMSFAFRPIRFERDDSNDKMTVITLVEVELFDVSPVTFPAYPQTDVQARSAIDHLQATIDALRRQLPAAPGSTAHPAEEADARERIRQLRRRLELAAQAV